MGWATNPFPSGKLPERQKKTGRSRTMGVAVSRCLVPPELSRSRYRTWKVMGS